MFIANILITYSLSPSSCSLLDFQWFFNFDYHVRTLSPIYMLTILFQLIFGHRSLFR